MANNDAPLLSYSRESHTVSQSIKLERGEGWTKYNVNVWIYNGATGFEIRLHGVDDPAYVDGFVIVKLGEFTDPA